MTVIVCCPHCGSQRIAHQERTVVQYEVKTFTRTPAGELAGEEFIGDPLPDWEHAERTEKPWHCLACRVDLVEAELLVCSTGRAFTVPLSVTVH